jgi:hypothetical protein
LSILSRVSIVGHGPYHRRAARVRRGNLPPVLHVELSFVNVLSPATPTTGLAHGHDSYDKRQHTSSGYVSDFASFRRLCPGWGKLVTRELRFRMMPPSQAYREPF